MAIPIIYIFYRHMLMDLVIAMVQYLDTKAVEGLYQTILPWLKVGETFIYIFIVGIRYMVYGIRFGALLNVLKIFTIEYRQKIPNFKKSRTESWKKFAVPSQLKNLFRVISLTFRMFWRTI
jgi:hypothetical protein